MKRKVKKEQGKWWGKIFWGVRGYENTVFSVFQYIFETISICFLALIQA